jgi:hypothetical protein
MQQQQITICSSSFCEVKKKVQQEHFFLFLRFCVHKSKGKNLTRKEEDENIQKSSSCAHT